MIVSPSGCIANIGERERRKRLTVGIAALVLAVATSGLFVYFGVYPAWSLLLFFPLYVGALGYFQSRDKT